MDFNEPSLRKPVEDYNGQVVKQMPRLIADGRVPFSTADVMERRLNSKNPAWKVNYVFVGDAVLLHPDGRVKVVLDSELLRNLIPQDMTRLENGALNLEDGVYESVKGAVFGRDECIFDKELNTEEAKRHELWRFVTRDGSLLGNYVDSIFPEMQRKTGMGIYLPRAPRVPQVRALVVYGLGDWSWLGGRDDLVDDDGRLLGIAPEAHGSFDKFVVEPTLEQAVSIVNRARNRLSLRLDK